MKRFIVALFLMFTASVTDLKADYVFWNQKNETNTLWNVKLTIYDDTYETYAIKELFSSATTFLKPGDNIVNIEKDMEFFVSTKKNRKGRSYTSYGQYSYVFRYGGDYLVTVHKNSPYGKTVGEIEFSKTTGQPLPGVMSSLLVGCAAIAYGSARKKKHRSN